LKELVSFDQTNFYVVGDVPRELYLHGQIGQSMSQNFVADSIHTR